MSRTLAEFIERSFIPEFVATKKSAGRDHFKAILKHVLPPEEVTRIFASRQGKMNARLTTIPNWPYIGLLRLNEINAEAIQRLTSTALERGYSIQTVTHLRNVIRSIFSHAVRTGYCCKPNPANFVILPEMKRKAAHSLSHAQLRTVLLAMAYPEREVALIMLLTDLSVAETCGLQWKYLNLFSSSRMVEQELIPPRTIAVRNQSYRGELSTVINARKRFAPLPRPLAAHLFDLKNKRKFAGPHDFVLVSRNGNPIHPGNLAARRLKSIGMALQIPWLSWSVFRRTRDNLSSELGGRLYDEFDGLLSDSNGSRPEFHSL